MHSLVARGKGTVQRHVVKDLLQETIDNAPQAVAEAMRGSPLAQLIANTQDIVVVPPHIAFQFRPTIGERW